MSDLKYAKKMKEWLTWHVPFTKDDKDYNQNGGDRNHYCPSCGNNEMRNNGQGLFRCKVCDKRFIVLEAVDQ